MPNGSSPTKSNNDGDKTPDEYFEVERSGSSDYGDIIVKTIPGNIISLKVKGSDTIGSLKLKLSEEELIPFDEQELILGEKVLENTDTFANLHIKKQSTLTLMRKTSEIMEVFVKPNTIGVFKSGPFKVRPSDTIGIYKAKRLLHERSALIFNELVLEDSGTFADFNINNGSILTLIPRSRNCFEICVKTHTKEMISLPVDTTDTIAEVKVMIECLIDIPVDEQALMFDKTILGDNGTLFDFNVNRNSTLILFRKSKGLMPLFIQTPNEEETITLEVKPSDTIHSIKTKLQDEEHISCDEHELIYDDLVLYNECKLADFDIKKESTLTLVRVNATGFMNVFVETQLGETFTLAVKPSDTIKSLKSKIKFKLGSLSFLQKFKFRSNYQQKSATLADYNLCDGSTVHLV